jgi:signal transduction histidine kinase/CheY-like chemotaxis protein
VKHEKPQAPHRLGSDTLVLYAGIAVVAAMLAIVGWTLADAREAARTQAIQETGDIALTLERDIEQTLTALDLSLRSSVRGMRTPGLAAMDPQVQQAILFDGSVAAQSFGGIFITDATGRVVHDSLDQGPPAIPIAGQGFFRALRDHPDPGLVIGGPLAGPTTSDRVLALARRISNPDGSFAGVAVAALRISFFQSLFSEIALGTNGLISLMNTDHTLIIRRPYVPADIGRIIANDALFPLAAHDRAGNFAAVSTLDGIERLYSYRQVGNWPLIVSVGFSRQEIYADWIKKTAIMGTALLLLGAFGIFLAWLLHRRIKAERVAVRAAAVAEASASLLADALAPLDALFKHSFDSMAVARIGADGKFVYEAVNPVWEAITAIPASQAIGRSPLACLSPDLTDLALPTWDACVRDGTPRRFLFETRSGSTPREWDAMAVPIRGADGRAQRLIVVGREITERNRLEAQLRQSQKMEVIGRLAAGVAHDFNNILQVIGGGIEILKDDAAMPPESRGFLEMVDEAARRGSTLTHHLLSYSRKQVLDPKPVDLAAVIGDLGGVLARTLGPNIELSMQIAPSIGPVKIDRSQLETALMNLAINAAHAMPDGGALRIEVDRADAEPFGELRPGRYVVVAVSDTGTGMTPEVLASLFEPFFTTKGSAGTGLGLSMVQGFSRQSGGDTRVLSTPGQGSRFEIWLPEALAPLAPPHPHLAPACAAPMGNVLLVDDAADVLITFSAFLRRGGFNVRQARDGQQALAALADGERFDVLVTDYMMPGMNGLELVKQARKLQPGLAALVVSGFIEVADFMVDLPGTILLHKPFKRDRFIEQISALVTRASA